MADRKVPRWDGRETAPGRKASRTSLTARDDLDGEVALTLAGLAALRVRVRTAGAGLADDADRIAEALSRIDAALGAVLRDLHERIDPD